MRSGLCCSTIGSVGVACRERATRLRVCARGVAVVQIAEATHTEFGTIGQVLGDFLDNSVGSEKKDTLRGECQRCI